VFSRTLEQVGGNARLFRGDIAEQVNRLKAQPGKDLSVSGAGIAAAFMQLGLIDEYCLYLHPVILGGGKPFFPRLQDPIALRLVETRQFNRGVVLLRYQGAEARP
jgi:dihydrofolate reductase